MEEKEVSNKTFSRRVFIGIELESIKEELVSLQNQLKPYVKKGNFVFHDNFHLTLQFIGEINEQDLYPLKEIITTTAQSVRPFEIEVDHLGQFTKKNKQVIWLGIKNNPLLFELYTTLQKAFQEKDYFELKKPAFLPHITIGRQMVLKVPLEELEGNIDRANAKLKVTKIVLYESKQLNGRLRYVPIFQQLL